MRTIYNAINTLGIDTKLEWFVLGIVILAGMAMVLRTRSPSGCDELDSESTINYHH